MASDVPPVPRDLLDQCAREPIRIPGGIQPHGALAVLRPDDLVLIQASANLGAVLDRPVAFDGSQTLGDLVGPRSALENDVRLWAGGTDTAFLEQHQIDGRAFHVSGHRASQGLILEFEAFDEAERGHSASLYQLLRDFLDNSDALKTVADLSAGVAAEVQALTGFNRVLIYRFDEEWNGTVIAEKGDGTLPSYLDLRFPASDIPAQARDLYRLNRLRLIPTATYTPEPLVPALCPTDGAPLDMSFVALRSVSPVHLEYMRNMGTAASLSISIVIDGRLWGLISCHHAQPRYVGPQIRAACDFLGRIVAQQIAARERTAEIDERLQLKNIETELVAHLARAPGFQAGLVDCAGQWLALTNSAGAAVVTDGIVLAAGKAPPIDSILALVEWLRARNVEQVYATSNLSADWPPGKDIAGVASGVIAVPISRVHASFILWFRPEVVQTVRWGGDPRAAKAMDTAGRLHPRQSFEAWKQEVRERARPWRPAELLSATDFRGAIINFVLQRAEERAQLTEELQRSNKELEAFSYSISHDLRAPFRHIAGYAELLGEEEPNLKALSRHYLDGIIAAALSAGELVDDLLHFSQLGRTSLKMTRIDMAKVMAEIRRSLAITEGQRPVEWEIGVLPPAWGDTTLVRQALFNLVDNALKYSRDATPPRIKVWGQDRPDEVLYCVEDNGVGFDMNYAGKLFQVFQRLHRQEDFEGTGIGLALTKRIIDRHGGTLEAKGAVGQGATFSFTLPKRQTGGNRGHA
ncbi:ATP-binding protein [Nitrospirillum sp. BR 11163]|uniref:ATP-binding protein n=1 Tax=Nitrospirillum sp. BR 11163 TaxID=3104323 RepID=UPI002AFE9F14|nr:ATP-binding protein [Nitrospirillum sp. BR 11163]MEA1673540.1 ATP-binding protein [Nitrospirillum sp. BR 11163]